MKNITLTALAATSLATATEAQTWKLDAAHSKLRFTATYLVISEVEGEFKKFDGSFTASKNDFSDIKVTVTADVNSISTENDMRDNHLKGDDFFNAEKYPTMTFVSTGMKPYAEGKYVLLGNLTIRDVTRPVQLLVSYNGQVTDPWGNRKAGFKAGGKINRKDFGLKYNNAAAAGEAVVGDDVSFSIDLVLVKG
jgi:polyisoprenoid-binding protein YceI